MPTSRAHRGRACGPRGLRRPALHHDPPLSLRFPVPDARRGGGSASPCGGDRRRVKTTTSLKKKKNTLGVGWYRVSFRISADGSIAARAVWAVTLTRAGGALVTGEGTGRGGGAGGSALFCIHILLGGHPGAITLRIRIR